MKALLLKLYTDSLFRNSLYLMLATAVLAGFGFFFWLIAAHFFTIESIGLATTLISAMNLIAILSLIGFNSTFVRFLPTSKNPSDDLNTGLLLVGIAATILATGFVAFVHILSPSLVFITASPFIAISFILFCIMTALNILTDAVFLAGRKAKYTLVINIIFSAIKMLLPLAFIGWGALGIFSAAAVGQTIGFLISVYVMIWKFDYKPQFTIKKEVVTEVWQYSASNYLAGVLNLLPITVLPIIITNNLGPKNAAYFYIAMMIANLLYVIPQATTRSLFAESSNDEHALEENVKKSIRMIGLLMTPAIVVLFLGAGLILNIFGPTYSEGGATFLRILAITGIAVSMYSVFGSLFQVKKNLSAIIYINICFAVVTIGMSFILLPLGLIGIGYALLLGNVATGIFGYLLYNSQQS